MCLTSDKPIEIKVVVDKPLVFYKILKQKIDNYNTKYWCTLHRDIVIQFGLLTEKNNGPGLLIKWRKNSDDYVIEEGLHGYLDKKTAMSIVNSLKLSTYPYVVVKMELPIGTNYAIGRDNGGDSDVAVVADRAIYREIKKVKKWEITSITISEYRESIINKPIFNSRAEAINRLDGMYNIREVEVDEQE